MSRTLPQECEHGRTVDWGDFGPDDDSRPEPCPDCEAKRSAQAAWFEQVLYGEVTATSGHARHDGRCNCARTVASILHRIKTEPEMVYAWMAKARAGQTGGR